MTDRPYTTVVLRASTMNALRSLARHPFAATSRLRPDGDYDTLLYRDTVATVNEIKEPAETFDDAMARLLFAASGQRPS